MKKYLLGSFAVILAVGFSAFSVPTKASKHFTALDWYAIDPITQETVSSTPSFPNDEKSVVLSSQDCTDATAPVCYIGAPVNSSVPVGTPASNFSDPSQQVLHQN